MDSKKLAGIFVLILAVLIAIFALLYTNWNKEPTVNCRFDSPGFICSQSSIISDHKTLKLNFELTNQYDEDVTILGINCINISTPNIENSDIGNLSETERIHLAPNETNSLLLICKTKNQENIILEPSTVVEVSVPFRYILQNKTEEKFAVATIIEKIQ